MLTWIELLLVLCAVAAAFCCPDLGSDWFVQIERIFSRLARNQKLSVLVIALAALAGRVALIGVLPIPQPRLDDEFSHLLLADTLVHGRLANPTPPMWRHFETIHVIMRPTYASMYPPAQGLFLAAGKLIAHHFFVGVCLSIAAMCAAICWMLQGWVPAEWALLGAGLAVIRLGTFSYWANSYWGGAAAATGGALVIGALPRIVRLGRVSDALIMALGLAILANSRPYEGLILSLPVAAALAIWVFSKRSSSCWFSSRRVIIPMVSVLFIAAIVTGYYFWRVTGDPFRMPQVVDRETYAVTPYFMWQSVRPHPVYHHIDLQNFYLLNELNFYYGTRTLGGAITAWIVKLIEFWLFYFGLALTVPLLTTIAILKYGSSLTDWGRKTVFLILASVFSVVGLSIEVFFFPHYAAPMTGLVYIFVVMALRRMRGYRWHAKSAGLFLARAIPTICVLMLGIRIGASVFHLTPARDWPPTWYNCNTTPTERVRILAQLNDYPGKQLVLVRYKGGLRADYDWVYNSAELDQAKIVWARDMGANQNEELIRYYPDRRAWLIQPDEIPAKLAPYSGRNDPAGE